MVTKPGTKEHIDQFLFDDSEELSRLRAAVDKDEKYMDVVKNEIQIHKDFFFKFTKSMKQRTRYRQLISLADLYANDGEEIPEFLRAAPYRRNFEKKYGHYVMRPNSFYQV